MRTTCTSCYASHVYKKYVSKQLCNLYTRFTTFVGMTKRIYRSSTKTNKLKPELKKPKTKTRLIPGSP